MVLELLVKKAEEQPIPTMIGLGTYIKPTLTAQMWSDKSSQATLKNW
jgi:hypothetical protein